MYKRGLELVTGNSGQGESLTHPVWIKIPKAADEATRTGIITAGSLVCQCTAGSNATCDLAATADTTGTPSRKILGMVADISDIKSNPLQNTKRLTTEEGYALVIPARGNKFRCLEDGAGGSIATADSMTGFVSLVIGAPTNYGTDDTNTPNPEPNVLIDSSTVASGTSANRACKLQGVDPEIKNASASVRAFLITFTDAFTEALS